jgi:hypothetical protein
MEVLGLKFMEVLGLKIWPLIYIALWKKVEVCCTGLKLKYSDIVNILK